MHGIASKSMHAPEGSKPQHWQRDSACSAAEGKRALVMMREVMAELQDPDVLDKAIPLAKIAAQVEGVTPVP